MARFSIAADPHALDPLRIHSDIANVELGLVRLSYEPFIDVDERGRPVPVLLTRIPSRADGGLSADGRTIRYHLRPQARWSDGSPVTAADVLFSLRRLARTAGSDSGYRLIARAEAPDPHTVVLRLRRAWAPAVLTFFTYGIEPAFVAPARGGGLVDGPFRLVRWTRGEGLEFRANERYWRGLPAVREIDVVIVPNAQTAMLQLRTGRNTWDMIPPSYRRSLVTSGLRFVGTHGTSVSGIAFNLRGTLRDPLLRAAIARSIDRAHIVRHVGFGAYPALETLQPYGSALHDPRVHEAPFDVRAADALFDRAGYPRGRGALRSLELRYAFSAESPTALQIATLVQAALRERGVTLDLIPETTARLYDPTPDGTLHGGRFDLAYVTWPMGIDGDAADLVTCAGEANVTGYCAPALDVLERRALAATNTRERRVLYGRIERRVARDVPVLVLLENDFEYAYRPALRGFMPNGFVATWNAARWRD
ncbi:MAG TPA: ABC transporter substrate-binding protein [Candidatus Limnocylindria bacterium]|nr:ABC transporter substrate-binding protein [Candidatus Limnocylindria bacterium]